MMILLGIMFIALGKTLGEYAEIRRYNTPSLELVGLFGLVSFVIGFGCIFIELVWFIKSI
jgi:hypothetical protein